jgi:molybdate transport system ATP-binding protein
MARSYRDKVARSDFGRETPAQRAARRDGVEQPAYVEVRLDGVRLDRGGRRGLEDVSWSIRPGERWVLAGANGAGKTQLLKLIAGSVWPAPTGREVRHYRWKGERWGTPYQVQDEIGYLGAERQDRYARYGWDYTVEQIVATGIHRSDIPLHATSEADRRRVAAILRRLRIGALSGRKFLTLSYGERRLALLARALASRPKLLLLDELLNGLDVTNHDRALRWLEGTARSSLPWVLSTHRVEDVPRSATHALVLANGRVAYRGPISRAALAGWLEPDSGAGARAPAPARRAARRAFGRLLVRLTHAHVHLDEHVALKDVSLTIRAGECWMVHGSNGSGKTTLLRTLYGDHGVAVGGRIERSGIVPGVPLQQFKERVGFIAPHLQADHPQELTATEVVQSGRYASIGLNDAPSPADRAAARRALRAFGLTALAARTLRELSYGQLRRVLFARACVRKPALLLLDEPLSGIDAPTRQDLSARLEALVAEGTTIVMSTHRRSEWLRCATHELELAQGEVRYAGPIRERSPSRRRKPPGRRSTRRRRSLP